MADFETAFRFMMSHEDPGLTGTVTHDDGGITRWGISQRAYPHLDIATLSLAEAEAIYRSDYWEPIKGGAINSQPVASKLLDMAVNMGVAQASRIIQGICIRNGAAIAEDGIVGPATVEAINDDDDSLVISLRTACECFYGSLVQHDPTKRPYLQGWLARASDVPREEVSA